MVAGVDVAVQTPDVSSTNAMNVIIRIQELLGKNKALSEFEIEELRTTYLDTQFDLEFDEVCIKCGGKERGDVIHMDECQLKHFGKLFCLQLAFSVFILKPA